MIKEISRARKALNHRPSNHDENAGGSDSTVSSTARSGHSCDLSSGAWGTNVSNASGTSSSLFGNGNTRKKKKIKKKVAPPPEARLSRVAISVVVPKPKQHSETIAITGDSVNENNKDNGRTTGNAVSASTPKTTTTQAAAPVALNNAERNAPMAPGENATSSKTRHYQPATVGATLRLDIVRTDLEGGGSEAAGLRVGGGGLAKSDSAAREILKWYSDEQVTVLS